MKQGVLIQGRGGLYTVSGDEGDRCVVRAKKKFRRERMTPLVGDRVRYTPGVGEAHGWLEEILPRRSLCLRPPAANITLLCVVVAPLPEPDWLLVDKLLLSARVQAIRPVLVLNKSDLGSGLFAQAREAYRGADIRILQTSALLGEGLEALRETMAGSLCCFAGQSGVGKSRLLSAVLGIELLEGELSVRSRRGKQTTRHTALLEGRGLRVLDTPGFSLLETPSDLDPRELPGLYPEFDAYRGACRFDPCFHDREPGCAVEAARKSGDIDAGRLFRYRELLLAVRTSWEERYA